MVALDRFLMGWLVIVALAVSPVALADEPRMAFRGIDKQVKELSLAELRERLTAHTVELFDPHHGRDKRYRGFAIGDLMDLGLGQERRNLHDVAIVFTALDGYRAVANRDKLASGGGVMVFEDMDVAHGWESIGDKQADPAPFYVVWTGPQQTTANEYPWPWQVSSISIVWFEAEYPAVYPRGSIG